jgi:hypothetical protein
MRAAFSTALLLMVVLVAAAAAVVVADELLLQRPWMDRLQPIPDRVAALLKTLTVDQKIVQTFATHTRSVPRPQANSRMGRPTCDICSESVVWWYTWTDSGGGGGGGCQRAVWSACFCRKDVTGLLCLPCSSAPPLSPLARHHRNTQ